MKVGILGGQDLGGLEGSLEAFVPLRVRLAEKLGTLTPAFKVALS